ncbi:MAG TPA: hypothetical protein VJ464_10720 [Blastocatellia bacterium]|nr:hypothetical protein [Blastocatellia bacterium]
MKENSKANNKAKDKMNADGSGPMLKFNHIRRETLPQTRIDVRALEMVRGYPLYVKEHTDHEPPIGEVLEQCIISTLSSDADFVEWLARQPQTELAGEQSNSSTSGQRDASTSE